ncbi:uncharacterized protein LOC143562306 [Bidens hawaiensis]|uniref:uncharacterized protein LOC143562306 n=1 Tax=Bidens hawaiensis TaxID=980011 RepID=UPI004048ED17
MILRTSSTSWIKHFLDFMGCCFGCCLPLEVLNIHGQTVKKFGLSDSFWSTSTYDIDFGTLQSQKSLSSIIISDPTAAADTGIQQEFVNHGLLLWNQTRLEWVESGKPDKVKAKEPPWNATYDSLLGTNKRFPRPIPLSEMVEFLVDIWEMEGLYD